MTVPTLDAPPGRTPGTQDAFAQALAALLPTGAAWPRDARSVLMCLVRGMAGVLAEHHQVVLQATREWLPQLTLTRLEEWEAAVGLPDPCLGPTLGVPERRAAVLARLRGFSGAYADSSPAAIGNLQAFCDNLGVDAVVSYHVPFRVGRERAGSRLGVNDGVLWVRLAGEDARFRVGLNRVGERLVRRPPEAEALACALEAVVPARYAINVVAVA